MKRAVAYLIPFALIGVAWFFYPAWIRELLSLPRGGDGADGLSAYGTYGDAFGALNTLFSGLAFAGIIVSIFLQSRELSETREELKGQKNQLKRQVFENTFFQMIRTLSDLINSAYFRSQKTEAAAYEGRECFVHLRNVFNKLYLNDAKKTGTPIDRYERYYDEIGHKVFGHYFRTLYTIVKYVSESAFLDQEEGFPHRSFYVNITRAQLSSDELFLLFFNCLSEHGARRFKPLVEEFALFEHLPQLPGLSDELVFQYAESAFGDNEEWRERFKNRGP